MNNLDFAIQVMVVGFLVVVFILFLLFGILLIFNRIFYSEESNPSMNRLVPAHNTKLIAPGIEPQIVAAVSAAIYQYLINEKPALSRAIISISAESAVKRGNDWKISGRKALLEKSGELANIRRQKQRENF